MGKVMGPLKYLGSIPRLDAGNKNKEMAYIYDRRQFVLNKGI